MLFLFKQALLFACMTGLRISDIICIGTEKTETETVATLPIIHEAAVIQISLGTDIYSVSKMLAHKNVTTTQVYANLVNYRKSKTANKISLK